jgi:hypothetical protein
MNKAAPQIERPNPHPKAGERKVIRMAEAVVVP